MRRSRPKSFPPGVDAQKIEEAFNDFIDEWHDDQYNFVLKISEGTKRFEAWKHSPNKKKVMLTEEFNIYLMVIFDE